MVSKINTNYYKQGIKVIDYGSHALNATVKGNDTVALLEFDLGYISVPLAEFKYIQQNLLEKAFDPSVLDCRDLYRCRFIMKCAEAK